MDIRVTFNANTLNIIFDDILIPNQSFSLEENINLTELVKSISNIAEKLIITPVSYDEFKKENECNDITLKIVEYIYKILDAYNRSYDEVYPTIESCIE